MKLINWEEISRTQWEEGKRKDHLIRELCQSLQRTITALDAGFGKAQREHIKSEAKALIAKAQA